MPCVRALSFCASLWRWLPVATPSSAPCPTATIPSRRSPSPGGRPSSQFLAQVHDAACRGFGTVLGPGYNAAHADHFDLQMGGFGICR